MGKKKWKKGDNKFVVYSLFSGPYTQLGCINKYSIAHGMISTLLDQGHVIFRQNGRNFIFFQRNAK